MTDYCAAADVVNRLEITSSTYNTELAAIVTAASRAIDHFCRIPDNGFAQADDAVRYYDLASVSAPDTLFLDAPIVSVTSIVNGDGATISASDYTLQPRNEEWHSRVQLKSAFAWRFATDGEIAITGKWGKATVVPADIKEACIMLSAWMFKRYQVGMQDATANPDLGQITFAKGIPEQVRTLLQPWRWIAI